MVRVYEAARLRAPSCKDVHQLCFIRLVSPNGYCIIICIVSIFNLIQRRQHTKTPDNANETKQNNIIV